jgi:hypothetical protein
MRHRWWLLAILVMAACNASSPTGPTQPATPEFSIRFVLANPASLSVSDPMPCTGDWSTCGRGSQPQGAVTTSTTTVRNYSLPSGTYRLTGVLQSSTPVGASVSVRIASGGANSVGGGVARDIQGLGIFGFTGEPSPRLPSVLSEGCAATFWTPSGALEWSMTFRVVATQASVGELCA